ncbi:MAG: hypothetical protein ABEI27_04045 [Halobellus sp.]|uniref:hypothetical protein n=1 Tax=Halobellus sp. TaxID=1979212 RepID=UPI0035D450CA
MFAGGLSKEVLEYVDEWIPEQNHRQKSEFQAELQEYLDKRLNSGVVAMGMGNVRDDVPVRVDHGPVEADVVAGDDIGIVVVRELASDAAETLPGRIDAYTEEFSMVTVVACGVREMGRWEAVQEEYRSDSFSVTSGPEVQFVHKEKKHFGKDPVDLEDDDSWFASWF